MLKGQPVLGSISIAVLGSISIAADDFAAVWVNGVEVASIGSISETLDPPPFSMLHTFDLTSYLKPGHNVIVVEAQNGPAWFAGGCDGTCSYAQNPAGVVFGGVLAVR